MSGIYIKGFPLPNNCGACPLRLAWCRERIYMVTRPERCPLIPVPDHGRLIDADALMKMCGMTTDCYDCPNGYRGWCKLPQDAANICEAIEDAPTIIPASGGDAE